MSSNILINDISIAQSYLYRTYKTNQSTYLELSDEALKSFCVIIICRCGLFFSKIHLMASNSPLSIKLRLEPFSLKITFIRVSSYRPPLLILLLFPFAYTFFPAIVKEA